MLEKQKSLGGGINEVNVDGGSYTITGLESFIFAVNSPTITFPGANTGSFPIIRLRTLSGTTAIAVAAGTIEISTLANGAATALAPRRSVNGWFQIT